MKDIMKKAFEDMYLGKKVIKVEVVEGEEGITVCLLFETGKQLNFTYNQSFVEAGKKYKAAMIMSDVESILKDKV